MDDLTQTIIEHEGSNQYAYTDSLGFLTIGVGRCIDRRCGRGLSNDEILYLLNNDIDLCRNQLKNQPFYSNQTQVRKDSLVELVFNMGYDHLMEFHHFLGAMELGNYDNAIIDLKDSEWARQVGVKRVDNICYRILNSKYP